MASVIRCLDCRRVYPMVTTPPADDTEHAADTLEQTVTDGWSGFKPERYEFVRVLGAGAQGKILLARDLHLEQLCVIKVVSVEDDEWAEIAVARLRAEAHAGVRVNHVNVARVFDCDCLEGRWYFVMEYVEGLNLRDVVHDADALDWAQVVDIGVQTAGGLAAIHAAGLVHRDVKPGNLMLRPDGLIKIMDLGLVKIRSSPPSASVTQTGQVLGTPHYMPPEQFAAEAETEPRSDIYALGATLYHLATGRTPFQGDGVLSISQKHRRDPITWSDTDRQAIPEWLRAVVERCMAKRPDDRFATAAELADVLRGGTDPSAASASWPSRTTGSDAAASGRPSGLVALTFRNLSAGDADDWIGEAIAEYLTNRLMEIENVHLADRRSLVGILSRQDSGVPNGTSGLEADTARIIEAARLVGAGTVIVGSFQRSGDDLRVSAHFLGGSSGKPTLIGNFTGRASNLFELEDRIAEKVLQVVGTAQRRDRRRYGGPGGTDQLEAHEKYMRSRRAFADGDYRRAIELAEQALAVDANYLEPVGFIGACWARLGEYDRAVEHHERQERIARDVDDQPRLAEALGNLGVMYYYKGEYALAHEFLENARNLSAKLDLMADAAAYHSNLGFVLMRLNRFTEAENAFAQAIDIRKHFGDLVSLVLPYNGMGGVLLKQDRYAEAREFYQRALALAEEIGDRVNVGVSQMNLGRCACLLADYTEAKMRFEAALTILEPTGFWNGLTLVYEHLAEMYLRQDNVDAALGCIDQRIELARRHGNNRMEAQAWEQKARAYEIKQQTDQALDCLKRSLEISKRPPPYESLHRYLEEVASRRAFD